MRRLLYALLFVVLLIGVVWRDHQRPFLPDRAYCALGAGSEAIVQRSASQLLAGSLGKGRASPPPFVSALEVCVHGSLWEGWSSHWSDWSEPPTG
jgi:hypothetical protein